MPTPGKTHPTHPESTLRVLIMDPLAEPFACACVPASDLHRYTPLQKELNDKLGRSVRLAYAETLDFGEGEMPDLIIGKVSWIHHQANLIDVPVRRLVMLTDKRNRTELSGLFLVRHEDDATSIDDLHSHRFLLGPDGMAEKHAAALQKLQSQGINLQTPYQTSPRCTSAALGVFERQADATVISDYAAPILENGKFFPADSLRIIGKTDPVPFIAVFGTSNLDPQEEQKIILALLSEDMTKAVSDALHSKSGFVKPE